jgi:hypothetical protein
MPVYRVAVRPNDSRPLTDIRATNDDECTRCCPLRRISIVPGPSEMYWNGRYVEGIYAVIPLTAQCLADLEAAVGVRAK